jgi:tetratricopeptide (TPR) repeat protein|tara:strand:- start:2192 stop:3253 length:1062 start_codon:yes stop_codon:yes gene_type:complete
MKKKQSSRLSTITLTFVFSLLSFKCKTDQASVTIPDDSQLEKVEVQVRETIRRMADSVLTNPNDAQYWADYAMLLDIHDFTAEGLIAYQEAERLDKTNFRWPLFHAISLQSLGDKKNLELYKKSMKIDSGYTPIYSLYGKALYDYGHIDSSIVYFLKAMRKIPCSITALNYLAKTYLIENRFDLANLILIKMKECGSTGKTYYTLLSELERKKGNTTLSLDLATKASEMPVDSDIMYNPIYDQVINMGISSAWYRYRAQKYMDNQAYESAIKEYIELIKIKPLPDDHFNLGLAYNMIGQLTMAENHYRICLSINPHYGDAFEKLAQISIDKSDMKKYYFYLNELGKIKSRTDI